MRRQSNGSDTSVSLLAFCRGYTPANRINTVIVCAILCRGCRGYTTPTFFFPK